MTYLVHRQTVQEDVRSSCGAGLEAGVTHEVVLYRLQQFCFEVAAPSVAQKVVRRLPAYGRVIVAANPTQQVYIPAAQLCRCWDYDPLGNFLSAIVVWDSLCKLQQPP